MSERNSQEFKSPLLQEAMETVMIPLSELSLSESNMRKGTDVDEDFVNSIFTNGVLQPPVVVGNAVDAGRRRFNALKVLASRDLIPEDHPVMCLRRSADSSKYTSIIENLHRTTPHPAEYHAAILKLKNDGVGVTDICIHLQIEEKEYHKYIRLSQLHSKILKAYASGLLSSDQVKAFAATPVKSKQIAVWKESGYRYDIAPWLIRNNIVSEITSDDAIVKFVGLDEYHSAGGKSTHDLFAEQYQILNIPLINKLARAKLDEALAEYKEQMPDWSWYEALLPSDDNSAVHQMDNLPSKSKKKTDEQKAVLGKLQQSIAKLDKIESEGELSNAQIDEYEALEDQLHTQNRIINTENRYYLKRDMKVSGIVLQISNDGTIKYTGGLQTKADIKAMKASVKKNDASNDNKSTTPDPTADAPQFTQALKDDVEKYKRGISKAQLLSNPKLAIDIMNYSLIADALSGDRWIDVFNGIRTSFHSDQTSIGDYEGSKVESAILAAYDDLDLSWLDLEVATERVEAYLELPQASKDKLLTYVSAITLVDDIDDYISTKTNADVSSYWTPTEDNYFSRVKLGQLCIDHKVLLGKEPPANAKKSVLVASLSDHIKQNTGTAKGWIPDVFSQ